MSTALTAAQDRAGAAPMSLLAHGVPLSLLLDLHYGPQSEELIREEAEPPEPART